MMSRLSALSVALLAAAASAAGAQSDVPDSAAAPPRAPLARALVMPASPADQRVRDDVLTHGEQIAAPLLRSTSTLMPRLEGGAYVVALGPRTEWVYNTRIPYSVNDGALWSGKGASGRVLFGLEAAAGPLRLVLAPEAVAEQNEEFPWLLPVAWDSAQRSRLTLPWFGGAQSVDLPYRPGEGSRTEIRPGESSLTLGFGAVEVGAATESQWWGPGVRNAILLSNAAGGFPHLLARTRRPVRTPAGWLEARWIAGSLDESALDTTSRTPRRYLSGAALVLRPTTRLQVGAARIVYGGGEDAPGAGDAVAALTRWAGAGDTARARPFEQMTSFFARYAIPGEHAEVYLEWARQRTPTLRQLLEDPEHTQGYTLGAQWARPTGSGWLRLQGEMTYLEKSATFRTGNTPSWYASQAVPQGYTHEGQPLGAHIGPGASGQWLALDYLRGGASVGAFFNRTRWATDAYYQTPAAPITRYRAHDVSILGGVRGGITHAAVSVNASWTLGRRYNYLFQNPATTWETRVLGVSPFNHTLRLDISFAPPLPRGR